ncbi:MAG: hypothetical protein QOG49_1469, partial [Frankiaceae bacterium]|nr:hypothetical protein [Frankiaceae bacterium]
LETAIRGQLSSGPARMAITTSGREATAAALATAFEAGRQPDGSFRLENVFRVVVARA